ncbi:hypothetical protein PHOSAC3_120237 [Mesotoga infera]|nr:hypothetical protein PHOSAC3_120237 [Mesotoga infera]
MLLSGNGFWTEILTRSFVGMTESGLFTITISCHPVELLYGISRLRTAIPLRTKIH